MNWGKGGGVLVLVLVELLELLKLSISNSELRFIMLFKLGLLFVESKSFRGGGVGGAGFLVTFDAA